MITRAANSITFTCDSPGCGESDTLQPVKRETDADIWLWKNAWRRQGRFLYCPYCVEARLAISQQKVAA